MSVRVYRLDGDLHSCFSREKIIWASHWPKASPAN